MTDTTTAARPPQIRSAEIATATLKALESAGAPITQRELADQLGMNPRGGALWQPLRRLIERGQVQNLEDGSYRALPRRRMTRLGRTVIYSDDPVAARRFLHTMQAEIDRLQRIRRTKRAGAGA